MRAIVLGAAALLASFPVQAQTTVAGHTPGSFRVTESGAAEYRIPIRVPPGIAGMEPRLALVYNSQAGNGLLGVGWSLEGLSAIKRCPRTMAQDGVRGGVNYDANDRFCLDGQRLMAISGAYGAHGTEYRTERESFTKVISYGTAGNGPAWFKAWTKSGQILEYGNTADSRIEAQGKTTVRLWALNKTSDTKGNDYVVSYTEDGANGQFRTNRIDYAGNFSVRFVYEARSDATPLYEGGSLVKTTMRLINLQTYVGETQVSEYRVAYGISPATQRSRPVSVTLCTAGNCMPATTFAWSGSVGTNLSLTYQDLPANLGWDSWRVITGDFNGDGRTDFAMQGASSLYVHLANGDGTVTFSSQDLGVDFGWSSSWRLITGDFNGDGGTDFAMQGADMLYVQLSNGDGTFTGASQNTPVNYGWGGYRVITGDFNGDGRTDFALQGASSVYVHQSNGNGSFAFAYQDIGVNFGWDSWRVITGDFNGDGRTDFAMQGADLLYVQSSNGDGTFTGSSQNIGVNFGWSSWRVITGDFNGDGRTDFAMQGADLLYTALSKGDGTVTITSQAIAVNFGWDSWRVLTGDFNGDGKTDFAMQGADMFYAAHSNGDGTVSIASQNTPANFGWTSWRVLTGDFSGDGRTEFAMQGAASLYTMHSGAAVIPDLLLTAAGGSGATTSVTYKPMTDATVYAKETGSVYPNADFKAALWIVSAVAHSDGIGGTAAAGYTYGGAKVRHDGRGFLGLRWMESTQQATGLKARTEFRQDWPYVGMPSVVQKTQSSGAVLSQATNTFSCTNPASGSACTVAAGNLYFPFVSQTVETGNDLNSASLPTVTTSTQYDAYGNATSVSVSTGDGHSKVTSNVFTNDVPSWLLGRLTRSTVQSTTP